MNRRHYLAGCLGLTLWTGSAIAQDADVWGPARGGRTPLSPSEIPEAGPSQSSPFANIPEESRQLPTENLPYGRPTQMLPPGAVPSPWIAYAEPGCCGPIGGDGPIGTELFGRGGPTLATGSGIIGQSLDVGWEVEGGGRVLFFNTAGDAAWTASCSVSFQRYDSGGGPLFRFTGSEERTIQALKSNFVTSPFTNASISPSVVDGGNVQIRGVSSTNFNVGLGRDWWLYGPAFVPGQRVNFRYGGDAGGRWGTAHVDLNRYGVRVNYVDTINGVPVVFASNTFPILYDRRHDVTGAIFLGTHGDLEVPLRSWTFLLGFRFEWDYTWSSLVPQQDSSWQNFNFLLSTGVRF